MGFAECLRWPRNVVFWVHRFSRIRPAWTQGERTCQAGTRSTLGKAQSVRADTLVRIGCSVRRLGFTRRGASCRTALCVQESRGSPAPAASASSGKRCMEGNTLCEGSVPPAPTLPRPGDEDPLFSAPFGHVCHDPGTGSGCRGCRSQGREARCRRPTPLHTHCRVPRHR